MKFLNKRPLLINRMIENFNEHPGRLLEDLWYIIFPVLNVTHGANILKSIFGGVSFWWTNNLNAMLYSHKCTRSTGVHCFFLQFCQLGSVVFDNSFYPIFLINISRNYMKIVVSRISQNGVLYYCLNVKLFCKIDFTVLFYMTRSN